MIIAILFGGGVFFAIDKWMVKPELEKEEQDRANEEDKKRKDEPRDKEPENVIVASHFDKDDFEDRAPKLVKTLARKTGLGSKIANVDYHKFKNNKEEVQRYARGLVDQLQRTGNIGKPLTIVLNGHGTNIVNGRGEKDSYLAGVDEDYLELHAEVIATAFGEGKPAPKNLKISFTECYGGKKIHTHFSSVEEARRALPKRFFNDDDITTDRAGNVLVNTEKMLMYKAGQKMLERGTFKNFPKSMIIQRGDTNSEVSVYEDKILCDGKELPEKQWNLNPLDMLSDEQLKASGYQFVEDESQEDIPKKPNINTKKLLDDRDDRNSVYDFEDAETDVEEETEKHNSKKFDLDFGDEKKMFSNTPIKHQQQEIGVF